MPPDWSTKAVLIEKYPDFYSKLMTFQSKLAFTMAGKLQIPWEMFIKEGQKCNEISESIYVDAQNFQFKDWAHLQQLTEKDKQIIEN